MTAPILRFVLVLLALAFGQAEGATGEQAAPARMTSWWVKADKPGMDPRAALTPDGWERANELDAIAPKGGQTSVWLRTTLPNGQWNDPSVFLFKVRHKFNAFIDGELLYQFGDLEDKKERDYLGEPSHIIKLPPVYAGRTLLLHVYSATRLGLTGETSIGGRAQHIETLLQNELPAVLMGAVPLFIGMASLLLFVTLVRLRMLLSFALFTFGFGVYSICHTKAIYLVAPHPLAWDHLQYFATYLTPFAFVDFTERALDGYRFPRLMQGKYVFVVLAFGALLSSAFRIVELDRTLPLFQGLLVLTVAALLVEVGLKAYNGSARARLYALGASLLCLAVVNDILVERVMVRWTFELTNLTMLGFVAALAYIVSFRVKQDQHTQVVMQKELETAGILQTRFLPSKFLDDAQFNLSAFNRAASQVGGDWFAYRIVENRWLQVHLGDVTGHGTRAALLAAFAKGAVDVFYEDYANRAAGKPALDNMHTLLNRALWQMGKGDATMTLASVSIDLHTSEVECVNSGHLSPLICKTGSARLAPIPGRNINLLGIESAFESEKPRALQLDGDEVLLLLSDGVYELFGSNEARSNIRLADKFMRKEFAPEAQFTGFKSLETLVDKDPLTDDVTLLAIKLNLRALPGRLSRAL